MRKTPSTWAAFYCPRHDTRNRPEDPLWRCEVQADSHGGVLSCRQDRVSREDGGRASFVFFVRPRRFGKSLFLDMLRLYYDRNEKANFGPLFGGLWISSHPTENRNRYLMLALDFSKIGKGAEAPLDQKFDLYLSTVLDVLFEIQPSFDVRRIVRSDVFPSVGWRRFRAALIKR